MQWVSRTMQAHPLVAFFMPAYAISWIVLIPAVLLLPTESLMLFFMIGGFGPLLAAVIVTSATGGRAGVHRRLKNIVRPACSLGLIPKRNHPATGDRLPPDRSVLVGRWAIRIVQLIPLGLLHHPGSAARLLAWRKKNRMAKAT